MLIALPYTSKYAHVASCQQARTMLCCQLWTMWCCTRWATLSTRLFSHENNVVIATLMITIANKLVLSTLFSIDIVRSTSRRKLKLENHNRHNFFIPVIKKSAFNFVLSDQPGPLISSGPPYFAWTRGNLIPLFSKDALLTGGVLTEGRYFRGPATFRWGRYLNSGFYGSLRIINITK